MRCRPDSNEDLHSLARLAEALTVKVSYLFEFFSGKKPGKRKKIAKGKNVLKKRRNQNQTGISIGSPKWYTGTEFFPPSVSLLLNN